MHLDLFYTHLLNFLKETGCGRGRRPLKKRLGLIASQGAIYSKLTLTKINITLYAFFSKKFSPLPQALPISNFGDNDFDLVSCFSGLSDTVDDRLVVDDLR